MIKDSEGHFLFSGAVQTTYNYPEGYALIGRMDKEGNIEGCGTNLTNLQEYNDFEIEEKDINVTFSDYGNVSVSDTNLYFIDINGSSEIMCRGKSKHRRPF